MYFAKRDGQTYVDLARDRSFRKLHDRCELSELTGRAPDA
jgi:hypothetical protein